MKRNIQYGILYAVLLGCIAVFAALTARSFSHISTMASGLAESAAPVIVIDAGHGGEDSGAVSASGLYEKDVNLSVAVQLGEMLELSGYSVVMIRTEDVSVNDEGLSTVRERKVSDLHNRLKAVEKQGENCILVSIHQNHFSQSQYSGAQMFYSPNHEGSAELAEAIRAQITGLLQPENKRESKPATDSIYLLWNAKIPAVIVECGFLSNPEESEKLADPRYQQQMAFAIYAGLVEYLSPAPVPVE